MALNPYTLNHLYQNGILDYVPTDLLMGTPMGTMMPMNNPYLDMAKQGGLYQNHGTATDSFHSSYTPAYTPQYHQSASASANSYVGANSYNANGSYNYGPVQIGSKSNAGGMATFNGYNVGTYNRNGVASAFGADGSVGAYSATGGLNTIGGMADTQNNIASGVNKTVSLVSNTPKLLLGVLAGAIGTIGIVSAFKHGKKPKTTHNSGFLSKLNPLNWFRKNK